MFKPIDQKRDPVVTGLFINSYEAIHNVRSEKKWEVSKCTFNRVIKGYQAQAWQSAMNLGLICLALHAVWVYSFNARARPIQVHEWIPTTMMISTSLRSELVTNNISALCKDAHEFCRTMPNQTQVVCALLGDTNEANLCKGDSQGWSWSFT